MEMEFHMPRFPVEFEGMLSSFMKRMPFPRNFFQPMHDPYGAYKNNHHNHQHLHFHGHEPYEKLPTLKPYLEEDGDVFFK